MLIVLGVFLLALGLILAIGDKLPCASDACRAISMYTANTPAFIFQLLRASS